MRQISVGFLWHMHQPYYKDPLTGNFLMPWVRLHSIRGYYDMISLLGEYPGIKSTFNLVPSLLSQLMDYTKSGFRDGDYILSQRKPSELSWEEKKQIVSRFFMCNPQTMIAPIPRYLSLYRKRGRMKTSEDLNAAVKDFSNQDLLDLQVLFNLSWIGFMARKDPDIKDLFKKGRDFTESEKMHLLDYHIHIMDQIIPLYKKRCEEGQIEVTTSPYYHPIGPLVMNVGYALRSMDTPLPDEPFAHPEDLNAQIARAISFHKQVFGAEPKGMWPSEGSVCPEMIGLLSSNGIKWTATDEDILFGSIRQARTGAWLYQPYKTVYESSEVSIFFRDKQLSDQISFVYSKNQASQSINDMMHHLGNIYKAARGYEFDPFVSIILDGENPWEYYPDGGEGFLRGLYEKLTGSQEIVTSRFDDFLEQNPPRRKITSLFTGSWINHNFRIWIGHEEDRRAWENLARTRNYVESKGEKAHPLAWEGIYIAEGSDWYWWYGDEFTTENDEEFDRIFRLNLRNCYELHNDPVPAELNKSLITPHDIMPLRVPVGFISPILDGTITHFYEWRKAGCYQPKGNSSSMYNQIQHISRIFYGFDVDNFYGRVDFLASVKGMAVSIHIISPRAMFLKIPLDGEPMILYKIDSDQQIFVCNLESAAYHTILEFGVPLKVLSASPPQRMRFYLSLMKDDLEMERHPETGVLSFSIPDKGYERVMWHV